MKSSISSNIKIEKKCSQIIEETWAEILNRQQTTLEDNFFEVGGHSLHALRITGKLQHYLEIEIPLSTLFDNPVLSDFISAINNLKTSK